MGVRPLLFCAAIKTHSLVARNLDFRRITIYWRLADHQEKVVLNHEKESGVAPVPARRDAVTAIDTTNIRRSLEN
jgi:hypothetical protein